MTKCERCGLEKLQRGFVCPQRACPKGYNRRKVQFHDDENIYGLASMRQSVEEDRAKRGR